jgi:hypothetical protein
LGFRHPRCFWPGNFQDELHISQALADVSGTGRLAAHAHNMSGMANNSKMVMQHRPD